MGRGGVLAILIAAVIIAGAILYSSDKLPLGGANIISELRLSVASQFRDPGSVQFRNIRAGPIVGYCGEANAKNALGGYVGYQKFAATKNSDTGAWTVAFDPNLVEIMCSARRSAQAMDDILGSF